MLATVPKTTQINLRISQEFREEIEALATYHGLSMSSYVHSQLVKAIRREHEATPEAFQSNPRGVRAAEVRLQKAPVVARISPAEPTKDDVRRMITSEQEDAIARQLKPRKRKTR